MGEKRVVNNPNIRDGRFMTDINFRKLELLFYRGSKIRAGG